MNYFETIKCNDNEIFHLDYHEKRIANTIGKNINLQDYIYPISDQLLKCKVLYNENEIIDVTFDTYVKRTIKMLKIIHDNAIEYNYKYENRNKLHFLLSKKEKADEIIIVKNNLVTDTTIANIAILINNQWYTPKKPLLEGTTRRRYLENLKIKEIDITIEMLKKATKIALLNAMIDFDIIEDYKLLI
jgi:4-amino-4-deoxychorismate lyase